VLSTFGVMFAPDHARAASELLRVCRPGGRIGLTAWTPNSVMAGIQATAGRFAPFPPVPGARSPIEWGTEAHVRELLGPGVADLQAEVLTTEMCAASPEARVAFNRAYVGPTKAIFDRLEPNFQSGYSPDEVANARKFVAHPDWAAMLRDTQAAIDAVKDVGPVGIIGFCLGGSIAYAAAARLSGLSAAIGYYGGAIVRFADEKPKVPTQLHFGEKDAGIPLSDVETIKSKRPDVEVYVYPGAQHGFHCDERASYDKASADIAWPRSIAFFAKHLRN